MLQLIHSLQQNFSLELNQVQSTLELESLKVKFLGKKGPITQLMKDLKDVPASEKALLGKQINDLKQFVTSTIEEKEQVLVLQEENLKISNETLDVSLPGRSHFIGNKHILTQTMDKMIDILISMGFSVQYGPEIETDYYNFDVLNITEDHPARDMQDTFYITPEVLLRTHTSNIQARVMERNRPPIRIIAPGKVYRNEAVSARSHVFFHQLDAIYIDKGVSFADLFSTLNEFLKQLFEEEVVTRFRPSYFPFVEPGVEVDIHCKSCEGKGCNLCKHTGWLEVLGAGMVHPEVLKNCDIDPEVYSGYAWGLGVGRLVMLKHGVTDIRMFTENDLRFLSQFTSV